MRSYGQYCPIARAAEVFAERWTPIVVRNLLLGCETFTEIQKGAPGIPKALLVERLKLLERTGIVARRPNPAARGSLYELTGAGRDLWDVCIALGTWGARWLEVAPEHLDPGVALWSMCNSLDRDRLPERRVVVRFDFRGRPKMRLWLLLEGGQGEVCRKQPGSTEDLVVTADSDWFVRWHMGRVSWSEATRTGHVELVGARDLVRAFPSWNKRSYFAGVKLAAAR